MSFEAGNALPGNVSLWKLSLKLVSQTAECTDSGSPGPKIATKRKRADECISQKVELEWVAAPAESLNSGSAFYDDGHTHHHQLTRKTRKTREGGDKIWGQKKSVANFFLSLPPLAALFSPPHPPPHLSEGAMLTFGPWGALSCPPATQWTLKHLAAEGNSHSSIFHEMCCCHCSHFFVHIYATFEFCTFYFDIVSFFVWICAFH